VGAGTSPLCCRQYKDTLMLSVTIAQEKCQMPWGDTHLRPNEPHYRAGPVRPTAAMPVVDWLLLPAIKSHQ